MDELLRTSLPLPKGDRDVIAVHSERRLLWIAEVEGDSGGQPEGKIYKAAKRRAAKAPGGKGRVKNRKAGRKIMTT